MKKKAAYGVTVLIVVALLCAFTLQHRIMLTGSNDDELMISYSEPVIEDEQLCFILDIEGSNQDMGIGAEPAVYADPACEKELAFEEMTVDENERMVYRYECKDPLKEVYIKAPVLYRYRKCAPVTTWMEDGAIVHDKRGNDWLTIEEIHIGETGAVIMSATPLTRDVPILLHLQCGEESFGCVSSLDYSEDRSSITHVEYLFLIPESKLAWVHDHLSSAQVVITDYVAQLSVNDGEKDIQRIIVG